MSLRIAFDMDGVLADFASAFRDVEVRLFGPGARLTAGQPGKENEGTSPRELRRCRDAIWTAIRETPDFWTTLNPIDPAAVRRIHSLTLRYGWEVFFITQRPPTRGDTVQRQTQRWLLAQGFDLPSVLVIAGSRGAAAAALRLHYHVDDSVENCVDVLGGSTAKPLLVSAAADEVNAASARKLGIDTAESIGECLDVLEQACAARERPAILKHLAALVGWK